MFVSFTRSSSAQTKSTIMMQKIILSSYLRMILTVLTSIYMYIYA
jgi:hypothetical protein